MKHLLNQLLSDEVIRKLSMVLSLTCHSIVGLTVIAILRNQPIL